MSKTERKSLFSNDTYQECLDRLAKLTPEARPQWGTMTVAQMLGHCAEVQEVANGKALEGTPMIAKLFKGMIRGMVVGDKPFPKSARTHPQYEQTSDRDFAAEKTRLLAALDAMTAMDKTLVEDMDHPLFGKMTLDEKGWSMYKHLDHHLSQFGV